MSVVSVLDIIKDGGFIRDLDADDDNDGISDIDEEKHGLNPRDASDADKDSDGDGVSNKDEIAEGTDPNDANSHSNQEATLVLSEGWNLIGANTNLTLQEFEKLISKDNLLIIQGASKTYKKEYIDSGTGFLNDFEKFEVGKGYWIKAYQNVEVEYPLSVNTDTIIQLDTGWNLINPIKELTISDIKTQIGEENLLIIQGSSKTYKKEYIDSGTGFLNDFEKFEEPKGYWIKVDSGSDLRF